MFTPPLRMFLCQICISILLTCYGRFSNEITCVQNNLPFAIKCFNDLFCFFCVFCLNRYLFSQNLLYDYNVFHLFDSSFLLLFTLPISASPV